MPPYPGQEEINALYRSSPLCISLSLFLWFSSVELFLLASSLSMFLLSSVAFLKLKFFLLHLVVVRFWRFLPFIGIRFPQGSEVSRKSKVAGGVGGRSLSGTDVCPSFMTICFGDMVTPLCRSYRAVICTTRNFILTRDNNWSSKGKGLKEPNKD